MKSLAVLDLRNTSFKATISKNVTWLARQRFVNLRSLAIKQKHEWQIIVLSNNDDTDIVQNRPLWFFSHCANGGNGSSGSSGSSEQKTEWGSRDHRHSEKEGEEPKCHKKSEYCITCQAFCSNSFYPNGFLMNGCNFFLRILWHLLLTLLLSNSGLDVDSCCGTPRR